MARIIDFSNVKVCNYVTVTSLSARGFELEKNTVASTGVEITFSMVRFEELMA